MRVPFGGFTPAGLGLTRAEAGLTRAGGVQRTLTENGLTKAEAGLTRAWRRAGLGRRWVSGLWRPALAVMLTAIFEINMHKLI